MSEGSRLADALVLIALAVASMHGQGKDEEEPIQSDSTEALIGRTGEVEGPDVHDISPLSVDRSKGEYLLSVRTRVRLGLEQSRATREGLYRGSPLGTYQRWELSTAEGFKGGLIAAKDPGEARIADFLSGYAELTDAGPLKRVILGDYVIETGQGLALWRGLDYGKGSQVLNPGERNGRGLLPSGTTDENGYLSGLAAELRWNRFSANVFLSRRFLSGTVDSGGDVTAIYTSGIFRTPSEEAKRGSVREDLHGLSATVALDKESHAGLTFVNSAFSRRVNLGGGKELEGERGTIISADYRVALPHATLFGECIIERRTGLVCGASCSPSRGTRFLALYRRYPSRSSVLHGLGFGERPGSSGEEGFYIGSRLSLFPGVLLSCYSDQFEISGGPGEGPFPERGHDLFARLELRWSSEFRCLLQYQQKRVEKSVSASNRGGLMRTGTDEEAVHRFRIHLESGSPHEFRIRGRVEKLLLRHTTDNPGGEGIIVYQDIGTPPDRPVSVSTRFVFFHTGSYDSRLSESEEDLSGAAYAPALFGEGERWYVLLSVRPTRGVECSVKYSRLMRDDVRHIGTGPDMLPGNVDDRVALQLDLGF